ncbi:MAG: diacylglycerol/polyprenol kinase family protein [Candidatus Pacearchaeota archaeon]|jgi:dolichol kinase
MKHQSLFELKRKLFHILGGILGIFLIQFNLINTRIIFSVLVFGIILSIICLKHRVPIISSFLDTFGRKEEQEHLPGRALIFAAAGVLLCLQLFEKNIALASLIILTFSDSTSLLVGKYLGKTKTILNKEKNIEGTIAGVLVSTSLASFFVPFYLAFIGSLAAGFFELLTIRVQELKVDDNLIIPLSAGTIMFLVQMFLI